MEAVSLIDLQINVRNAYKMKKIVRLPRNRVTKAVFSLWSNADGSSDEGTEENCSVPMATTPGNMYQKQDTKKRPTGLLQSSSGSMSKLDRHKDKDIPLTYHPSSPTLGRANIRKLSQITLHSDASGEVHNLDNNCNVGPGTPKGAAKLHQVCEQVNTSITTRGILRFSCAFFCCFTRGDN